MKDHPSYDVAVVGGGIVGLTTAALFARVGARVCLIEPALDRRPPDGPLALRNYAITPGVRRVLEAVGAWSALAANRIGEFAALEVWDARSSGRIGFAPPATYSGAMGWIVEHQNLVGALSSALANCVVTASAVTALENGSPARLSLADGRELQARLVIGADGTDSLVRDAAAIGFKRERYPQRAWVANVVTTLPHGAVARQRFLTTGPLAFLPLPDAYQSAIVWSCTEALYAELEPLDEAQFASRLGSAFEHRLGDIKAVSARVSFALERARAEAWYRGSCVLVGDAAHVVHPLAGQGLNLGLMDAAALCECLAPLRQDRTWPQQRALRRYERWRKSEALRLTLATDGLQQLFSRDERAIRTLRGFGMRVIDAMPPLTRWFSEQAMGLSGDVPRSLLPAAIE